MKKDSTIFLMVFLSVCTIAYLSGSFVNATFNIKQWTETSRLLVGLFGPILGAMFGSIANINENT